MAKTPMSDAQKYRPANARGMGPGAEGKAKIRASNQIASKSKGYDSEATVWGLKQDGGKKLAEDYSRSTGAKADSNSPRGYYKNGGMVAKGKPAAKKAMPPFMKKGK